MKYLAILLLLTGCATPTQHVEPQHLAWSAKTTGHQYTVQDVRVDMNRHGLLVLYVDDEAVHSRENWCIEIVRYEP